ncbi:MAG: hypothetical protein Q8J74_03765 [Candidatus Didemnitutus sp.]|nr:hypothetical protein [Candidatus Didemnitutus sp.]
MITPTDSPSESDNLRAEISELEKLREQIHADMETMRVQEENLRSYENRLRRAQTEIVKLAPVPDGRVEIEIDREKLSRQRALLEAERRALTDERLIVREEQALCAKRSAELDQREAWVQTLEARQKANSFPAPNKIDARRMQSAKNFFLFSSKRVVGPG